MRARAPDLARILVLFVAAGGSLAAGADLFELRGKISGARIESFRDATPQVFLHGSTTPFTTHTLADSSGQFRFQGLLPGMYTLIIAIPRAGEMSQTIEVGPTLADSKRRIQIAVVFEPKTGDDGTRGVSISQLSIPDSAKREYEKALARLEKRQIPETIAHLKKAVERAPAFTAAWNHLGTIAYHSRDYAQAEQYFREALKHDPDSYAPLVNLGGALISQGKKEESLQVNLSAVKARPDDALAQSQLGQSYFFLRRLEEAKTNLKQAKALDPSHFSFPQLVLAEIYAREGNSEFLIKELEEFLRFHPDSKLSPGIRKSIEAAKARVEGERSLRW